jgi:hypothetical protein
VIERGSAGRRPGTRLSLVHTRFTPDQMQDSGGARHGRNLMGGKPVDLLARTA